MVLCCVFHQLSPYSTELHQNSELGCAESRTNGTDSKSAANKLRYHNLTVALQAAALLEEDPAPTATAGSSAGIDTGGADVLQIEDSGDALDIDLDDPFQAQMLDISHPVVADKHMLKCLKQQVLILSLPGSCCILCCALETGVVAVTQLQKHWYSRMVCV